jgi:FKBP-type peptidyl-prolyl cis-trans isomerase
MTPLAAPTRLALLALLVVLSPLAAACSREEPPAAGKPAPPAPSPAAPAAEPASKPAAPTPAPAPAARTPRFIANAELAPGTLPDAATAAKPIDAMGATFDRSTLPAPVSRTAMPSGVVIQELALGDGNFVLPAAVITANMIGTLEDGTIFDDSRRITAPLQYDLLQLIPGLRDGVVGMRVGGLRRITIPPELAFGSRGLKDAQNNQAIPPDATVVIDVELLAVQQKVLAPGQTDPNRRPERPRTYTPIADAPGGTVTTPPAADKPAATPPPR